MKQNFLAIVATAAITLSAISCASAQTSESNGAGNVAKLTAPSATKEGETATNAASSFSSSKMSSRAVKNFSKNFKNVSNANWYVADDGGFIASFADGASKTDVMYDNTGRFVHSIKRYGASELPQAIKADMRNAYGAYTIVGVEEISVNNSTIYLVHIQLGMNAKTVRICDGDLDVIEDLYKQ